MADADLLQISPTHIQISAGSPVDIVCVKPLLHEGPDSITTETTDPIRNVKLRRVDLEFPDAFHQLITVVADNIFRSR